MPRRISLLFFILFIVSLSGTCHGFDDGDFQYWNTESISWKVDKDWKMKLEEEFRFGDNSTDFYYQHSDLGITYTGLGKWLDLGINYRLVFEESDKDWDYENRPHYNVTVKHTWEGFSVSTRNRFEHRFVEDEKNGWRYRNKFTLKLPKMTEFEIQPYVADEIFVDFDKEELDRNRLCGGISMKLYKNLKGEVFYLWQASDKGDHWLDFHVVGSKLNISF